MEQELIKKKREIIDTFLKKGILITSELLKEINNTDSISRAQDSDLTTYAQVTSMLITKS